MMKTTPGGGVKDSEAAFMSFMSEVKIIERNDSELTNRQQIDRLLRPGSKYFNLDPYEVLQLPIDCDGVVIKKKYRQLSMLLHPDKNPDDSDRAQEAFEILNTAHKKFEDEEVKRRCVQIYKDAREKQLFLMEEKRKQLKKEGQLPILPEDDPEIMKQTVYKEKCKMFADLEIRRLELEGRDMRERKRTREDELKQEDDAKVKKEVEKAWEEGRDRRVNNWRNFQAGKRSKKKLATFKPPKHKQEKRDA